MKSTSFLSTWNPQFFRYMKFTSFLSHEIHTFFLLLEIHVFSSSWNPHVFSSSWNPHVFLYMKSTRILSLWNDWNPQVFFHQFRMSEFAVEARKLSRSYNTPCKQKYCRDFNVKENSAIELQGCGISTYRYRSLRGQQHRDLNAVNVNCRDLDALQAHSVEISTPRSTATERYQRLKVEVVKFKTREFNAQTFSPEATTTVYEIGN